MKVAPDLALRPAADELDHVERLLADAGLPTADVREKPEAFYVAVVDGERVGCGGVEVPGDGGSEAAIPGGDTGSEAGVPGGDGGRTGAVGNGSPGLLRSVVVAPERRGEGVGRVLCEALADQAGSDGVGTLYLLTTDATEFFAGLGYERVDREAVPAALRDTAQFAELCPASATVMRRRLADPG